MKFILLLSMLGALGRAMDVAAMDDPFSEPSTFDVAQQLECSPRFMKWIPTMVTSLSSNIRHLIAHPVFDDLYQDEEGIIRQRMEVSSSNDNHTMEVDMAVRRLCKKLTAVRNRCSALPPHEDESPATPDLTWLRSRANTDNEVRELFGQLFGVWKSYGRPLGMLMQAVWHLARILESVSAGVLEAPEEHKDLLLSLVRRAARANFELALRLAGIPKGDPKPEWQRRCDEESARQLELGNLTDENTCAFCGSREATAILDCPSHKPHRCCPLCAEAFFTPGLFPRSTCPICRGPITKSGTKCMKELGSLYVKELADSVVQAVKRSEAEQDTKH